MDARDVIGLATPAAALLACLVGVPVVVTARSARRHAADIDRVVGQLLPGQPVHGVVVGRMRRSSLLTGILAVVGTVVVGRHERLGAALCMVLLLGVVALLTTTHRHALVVTTTDEVVVLTTTGELQPKAVLGRIPLAAWQPVRSWGSFANTVAGQVVVVDRFGQRSGLPDQVLPPHGGVATRADLRGRHLSLR